MAESLDFQRIAAQLGEADSAYVGISDFRPWNARSLDFELWQRYAELLREERDRSDPSDIDRAVRIALRAAAIDTGAIEGLYETDRGFTFAVAYQQAGWEIAAEEKGDSVRALFEAQLQAYELVLDAATGRHPVTESWIRQLHEIICAPQETHKVLTPQGWQTVPFRKGAYKEGANHVIQPDGRTHSYAPVTETPHEMRKFVEELNTPDFLQAHPARQAAYAHHAFAKIHPFADGNGRVARAIASLFLYKEESIPFVVYADLRDEYLASLREADVGNIETFIDFVIERGIDTLGEVRQNLKLARSGDLTTSVSAVRELLTGQGGITHKELDAVADRVLNSLAAELTTSLTSLDLPADMTYYARLEARGAGGAPAGFRPEWTNQRTLVLRVFTQPPASANVEVTARCFISTNRKARFPFLLQAPELDEELRIRLNDVFPQERPSFKNRLANWSELLVAETLRRVKAQAEDALHEAGYAGDPG